MKMAGVSSDSKQIVSAGTIEATFTGAGKLMAGVSVSDLGAVTMSRGAEDLLVSTAKGKLIRMQQPSKVGVVNLTMKIPLDQKGVESVLGWFTIWNEGYATEAQCDVEIKVLDAKGDLGYGYKLEDAVPTECKIDGVKPGSGVGNIDIKLTCNNIVPVPPPKKRS